MAPTKSDGNGAAKESATKDGSNPLDLSKRELDVALLAWQCLESEVKIDYQKLVQIADFATLSGAQKQWSLTKAKLKIRVPDKTTTKAKAKTNDNENNDGDDGAGPATPKAAGTQKRKRAVKASQTPGSTTKKGRVKKDAEEEDDDGFLVDNTPSSAVKAIWQPDGDYGPSSPTPPPKKRGRPRKKKTNAPTDSVVDKPQEMEVDTKEIKVAVQESKDAISQENEASVQQEVEVPTKKQAEVHSEEQEESAEKTEEEL